MGRIFYCGQQINYTKATDTRWNKTENTRKESHKNNNKKIKETKHKTQENKRLANAVHFLCRESPK